MTHTLPSAAPATHDTGCAGAREASRSPLRRGRARRVPSRHGARAQWPLDRAPRARRTRRGCAPARGGGGGRRPARRRRALRRTAGTARAARGNRRRRALARDRCERRPGDRHAEREDGGLLRDDGDGGARERGARPRSRLPDLPVDGALRRRRGDRLRSRCRQRAGRGRYRAAHHHAHAGALPQLAQQPDGRRARCRGHGAARRAGRTPRPARRHRRHLLAPRVRGWARAEHCRV